MKSRSIRWPLAALFFAAALPAAAKSSSVLDALKSLLPSSQQEAVAAATPVVSDPVVQAVPPGRGLSPEFSDPGRVSLLLDIVARVRDGRPLPFPKDGVVFANREGRLPAQPAGFYREYTVLPPAGSPDIITVGGQRFRISPPQGRRGAERLIIGGGERLWYSPDHYKTFIALTVLN
jgi:guanyl-specific ribonuclease Sa